VFLLKDTGQESLFAARYRLASFDVEIAEHPFRAGGVSFPAGSWILPAKDGLAGAIHSVATDLALDFVSAASSPDVAHHAAGVPRIGVWVPWADTDSIGWIRYILDQRRVPYGYVRDEDIRAGNLREHLDVLLYGHVDLELAEQIEGCRNAGPHALQENAADSSFGTPAESDDITGGIGYAGMAEVQRFVDSGGLLLRW